jgi:hypothetical protein
VDRRRGGSCLLRVLVSLIRNASTQGATYWRHATAADVGNTYWFLFRDLWSLDLWIIVLLAGAIMVAFVRGGSVFHRQSRPAMRSSPARSRSAYRQ